MLRLRFLTPVLAGTALVSTGFSCISETSALAISFDASISLTESELLPPWDVPATGTGSFEFDGFTNTFGGFQIDSLLFDNFGVYPPALLPPELQMRFPLGHPIAYEEGLFTSPLLPYVFTPDQSQTTANPSEIRSVGMLEFQTSVGLTECRDGIGPAPLRNSGGPLCGATLSNLELTINFTDPIFDPVTNHYSASTFGWQIINLDPNPVLTYPDIPPLVLSGIDAESVFAGGESVDLLPTDFNFRINSNGEPIVDPFANVTRIIPANFAQPVPEPSHILGALIALGAGVTLKRAQLKRSKSSAVNSSSD